MFAQTSEQYRGDLEIIEVEGKGLVPLIEQGNIEQTRNLLSGYLATMIDAGVDKIVLGCSHYPFLAPVIRSLIPSTIDIIDSGEAVARQTKVILSDHGIEATETMIPYREFYTNGDLKVLNQFLELIGMPMNKTERSNF